MSNPNSNKSELEKKTGDGKKPGIKDYLKNARRKGLASLGQQSLISFEMPESDKKEPPSSKADNKD